MTGLFSCSCMASWKTTLAYSLTKGLWPLSKLPLHKERYGIMRIRLDLRRAVPDYMNSGRCTPSKRELVCYPPVFLAFPSLGAFSRKDRYSGDCLDGAKNYQDIHFTTVSVVINTLVVH